MNDRVREQKIPVLQLSKGGIAVVVRSVDDRSRCAPRLPIVGRSHKVETPIPSDVRCTATKGRHQLSVVQSNKDREISRAAYYDRAISRSHAAARYERDSQ